MNESIAEYYYEQLNKTENVIPTMVSFYKALFSIEEKLDSSVYQTFGRLIRIYGKDVIYFALLDIADMDNIDFNGIGRLLSYFAKKRLSDKFTFDSIPDLSNLVRKNLKEMEKKKRLKIPEVFDE